MTLLLFMALLISLENHKPFGKKIKMNSDLMLLMSLQL